MQNFILKVTEDLLNVLPDMFLEYREKQKNWDGDNQLFSLYNYKNNVPANNHEYEQEKSKSSTSDRQRSGTNTQKTNGKSLERENLEEKKALFLDARIALRPLTDAGNAECFKDCFKDKICWLPSDKVWLVFNGIRWIEDFYQHPMRYMLTTVRKRRKAASRLKNRVKSNLEKLSVSGEDETEQEQKKNKLQTRYEKLQAGEKWAGQSESTKKLNAALSLGKIMMSKRDSDFDKDPYLLCCKNGVIDLRTGKFRPARPEDCLRSTTHIKYDPQAKCNQWIRFLDEIFEKDTQLIDFIQLACGYTLTADVSEECLFFCWGEGSNGKSTFLNILKKLLGDFAINTPSSTFKAKSGNSSIPNDVARMNRKRLVTCSEFNENALFNEDFIKCITGRDVNTSRFLRKEFFDFMPTCKIWLTMNHLPHIKGNDDGIWRRIIVIPFRARFADKKGISLGVNPMAKNTDPTLIDKLTAELSGILNWVIQGCLKWQKQRLILPKVVRCITTKYRTANRQQDGIMRKLNI